MSTNFKFELQKSLATVFDCYPEPPYDPNNPTSVQFHKKWEDIEKIADVIVEKVSSLEQRIVDMEREKLPSTGRKEVK